MLYTILWRGNPLEVNVRMRGEYVSLRVEPAILEGEPGLMPGLLHTDADRFGWLASERPCDVLTAWRTLQALRPGMRIITDPAPATLRRLLSLVAGRQSQMTLIHVAKDFGVEYAILSQILEEVRDLMPPPVELEEMLVRMSPGCLSAQLPVLKPFVGQPGVLTQPAADLLLEARSRQEEILKQQQAREAEIAALVPPRDSPAQLLVDLGVNRVLYEDLDSGRTEPHVESLELDKLIKRNCLHHPDINEFPISVTARTYPSQLVPVEGVQGAETCRLRLTAPQVRIVLHQFGYRPGGPFVIRFTQHDLSDDRYVDQAADMTELPVVEFRKLLGELLGLEGALPVHRQPEHPRAQVAGLRRGIPRGRPRRL